MSDVEDSSSSTTLGTPQHVKAQEFKNSGNDKFSNNNFKGAIVDYRKGLLHEPNNSDLHANLSAAFIHLEKYVQAEEHAVYAIQLKPNFYKGYMRAAKAAHGKGMTRLALKRLNTGLTMVSDPNGIKELNRLKTQYTVFLSLGSNADRQMDFDSDTYQSEDDNEVPFSDEDDSRPPTPDPTQNLSLEDPLPIEHVVAEEVVETEQPDPLPNVSAQALDKETETSNIEQEQEHKSSEDKQPESNLVSIVIDGLSGHKVKLEESKLPNAAEKKELYEASVELEESTERVKIQPVEKDVSFDKKENLKELQPNNILEPDLENHVSEKDVSFDKKENLRDVQPSKVLEPVLEKHVSEFKDHLKCGSEAFLSGNYRKALENYKSAEERVGVRLRDYDMDDRQFDVIKYLIAAALIHLSSYDDIVKGIQILNKMEVDKYSIIPALYIQKARGYYKLNRFKAALGPLERLQQVLDNVPIFPTFTWPGTTETIQETTPAGLKNAMKEVKQLCRMSYKPTAVCRFDNCFNFSTHIVPSDAIYFSDPDFIGYVRMMCEEKCHIEFHISCWKAYKESICGIGKVNDKDFLGRRCLTTDCVNSEGSPSMITMIEIIDSDGNVKSVNKVDPKTTADSRNAKKKKCKLDDKENKDKSIKPKKTKEKKVRDIKKPAVVVEEEVEVVDSAQVCSDSQKALETRQDALVELRSNNFGLDDKYWNPKLPFYGRSDETTKAVCGLFLGEENNDSKEVRDVKDFIFSYFLTVLKDEGPLKQSEVEELWKESIADFCDVKGVLPNMKSMCELLMESTRFCQLEDYICLSDQLDEAYQQVRSDTVELVNFLMTGSALPEATSTQSQLPDLLRNSADAQSSSEDEIVSDSGDESEDTEDDASEEEEDATVLPEPTQSHQAAEPPKTTDEGSTKGYSIQDIITEMTRLKTSEQTTLNKSGATKDLATLEVKDLVMAKVKDDESSADTFYTACSSSFSTTQHSTSQYTYESSNEHGELISNEENTSDEDESQVVMVMTDSDEMEAQNAVVVVMTDSDEMEAQDSTLSKDISDNRLLQELTNNEEAGTETDKEYELSGNSRESDKASQCELTTEEKHMQTPPKETRDGSSQTVECYEEFYSKLVKLTDQIAEEGREKAYLRVESHRKGMLCDELTARLQVAMDESKKKTESLKKVEEEKASELARKESRWKLRETELTSSLKKIESKYASLVAENEQNKSALVSVRAQQKKIEESSSSLKTLINEWQLKCKELDTASKTKIEKFQTSHLNDLKSFWENQVILLRKRCVEKISEMQVWFSLTPTEEMEQLPSLGSIKQIITRWGEISRSLHQLEETFKVKYDELESKISQGEELEDLSIQILPQLPEEPMPLPLDKVHKEITEKHLKKIGDLTQLVVNQQLEIHQLMNTFQMTSAPRTQSPMTTAFGSLALQYPYPQFGQTPVPTDPTPAPAPASVLQTDVQTLLQESSKVANLATPKQHGKTERVKPVNYSSLFCTMPPPATIPSRGPPPLMGVAQNLLKNSTSLTEKKDNERLVSGQNTEARETTPVLSVSVTPEKSKKKKKTKSESRDVIEVREPTPSNAEASQESLREDDTEWSVVLPKSALLTKQPVPVTNTTESKLKNKKKLLDKLQLKFPTVSLKELDEIVKLVREQNNGSLSGLPFNEIESRVEMIVTKRHYSKTSGYGLIKFSAAAWGTVKQETTTYSNVQLEECIICLEPMGKDRTKVDCNHEFHTKCIRKWLKEKSVCPLCTKFTTMPDEFPAL